MKVDEVATIDLKLSTKASRAELARAVAGPGPVTTAEARISRRVRTQLTGPKDAVTIEPLFDASLPRLIDDDTSMHDWQWDITAKRKGTYKLHLSIFAEVDYLGRAATAEVKTFDRSITIQITVGQQLGGFVENNWQWLWAVILAPVVALVFSQVKIRWVRRREGRRGGTSEPLDED